MIGDSVPWKDELLKIADRLENRKTQRRWTERTGFLAERDIMVSAYAIRKLLEARKVSDIPARLRL
jgi:glycerol kinase